MSDLSTQLRSYLDETSRPVTADEILFGADSLRLVVPPAQPVEIIDPGHRWRVAVAAAVAVLVLIGGVALVAIAGGDGDVVDQPPTSLVPTTVGIIPSDWAAPPDTSKAAATRATPLPDLSAARAPDPTEPELAQGALPETTRLDFLFELCGGTEDSCFRDAQFVDEADSRIGAASWTAGTPFHIRHGFPAPAQGLLAPSFDVAVYIAPMDAPGELGGVLLGPPDRYSTDFVVLAETDRCGPSYRTLESGRCQWFVHEFPSGLQAGRWALWVVWEAPCSAWMDLGLVAQCRDPDAIESHFSSGVDLPVDGTGTRAPQYVNENNVYSTEGR